MADSLDLEIARWIADHRVEPLTRASQLLEDLGRSPGFFTLVTLGILVLVAVRRLWSALLPVAVAWLVTIMVTAPLKEVFDRPRPPADLAITTLYEPAMPSSHAIITSAAVVAVLMAPWWSSRRIHRLATMVGVAGCLVAGAAMIYLGGHWLTDVLVGWVLGVSITGAVMLLWRRLPLPGGRGARETMSYAPHRSAPQGHHDR